MMRSTLPWHVTIVLAIALASSAGFSSGRATRRADDGAFPHAVHGKLFPTCSGCHAGITVGDSATMFPPATACAQCHNGRQAKAVAWSARRRPPSNLRFDHAAHLVVTDSANKPITCARCHGGGASSPRMLVTRPVAETCLGCHAPQSPSHLAADSPCATCHLPLTHAVSLSDSMIASLPKPPSHGSSDFLATHGMLATRSIRTCATCHARESCARCHVNAGTSPQIQALGTDARVARLVAGRPATYSLPASHRQPDFISAHGSAARANAQTCATCHTQTSCRSCHIGSFGAREIEALPRAEAGVAPGVQLVAPHAAPLPPWPAAGLIAQPVGTVAHASAAVATPPPRIVRAHPLDFVRTHGTIAASGRLACAGCHTQQSFCTGCHQGTRERRYHPVNFTARHPSESYARETQCASCHNTESFCRSCHREVAGIAAGSNRRSGAAHAGQPAWLLQHGEAARRGMSSCASCHQPTDCMQCHSALRGRINPHGPAFDADRMRKKNPSLCLACHLTLPT